jgi:hypothetical protein
LNHYIQLLTQSFYFSILQLRIAYFEECHPLNSLSDPYFLDYRKMLFGY